MENRPTIKLAIQEALHTEPVELTWLAGDGSDRVYYEVQTPAAPLHALMVLGEKDRTLLQKGLYDWVTLQGFLAANNIKVPHIEQIFPAIGVILLEHLGMESLEQKVLAINGPLETVALYQSLFPLLADLLRLPPHPVYIQRAFDSALLTRELVFFKTHFLERTLHLFLSQEEEILFLQESNLLTSTLAEESCFFVHRDFHARNLLFHLNSLYVIDFQDARLGSPVYDLLSLLFDPYVPLSIPIRLQLFNEGVTYLQQCLPGLKPGNWKGVFLQRMLKILGSYGFLGSTKNRTFLNYIPTTLSFLQEVAPQDARWPFLSKILLQRIYDAQEILI